LETIKWVLKVSLLSKITPKDFVSGDGLIVILWERAVISTDYFGMIRTIPQRAIGKPVQLNTEF